MERTAWVSGRVHAGQGIRGRAKPKTTVGLPVGLGTIARTVVPSVNPRICPRTLTST
mgnify:CR=1 FL=1